MNAAVSQAERQALLHCQAIRYESTEAALQNVDSYADWLAGECMYQTAVDTTGLQYQVRTLGEPFDEGAYQLMLDAATVPQLQHITLDCPYERRAWLAMLELRKRYLTQMGFVL